MKTDIIYGIAWGEEMLKHYLNTRASSRCNATIIKDLKSAAEQAAERGDSAAALAFQGEIDRLYDHLADEGQTYASPRPAPDGEEPSFNPSLIAVQWSAFPSEALHQSKSACVIDCGERGKVIIAPSGIALTGEVLSDPKAIQLCVRHAQLNWKHGMRIHGSDEVKFKFAVAAKIAGVKVKGARIPRARRAEAEALIQQWRQDLGDDRRGSQPARPSVVISSVRQRPAFGQT